MITKEKVREALEILKDPNSSERSIAFKILKEVANEYAEGRLVEPMSRNEICNTIIKYIPYCKGKVEDVDIDKLADALSGKISAPREMDEKYCQCHIKYKFSKERTFSNDCRIINGKIICDFCGKELEDNIAKALKKGG